MSASSTKAIRYPPPPIDTVDWVVLFSFFLFSFLFLFSRKLRTMYCCEIKTSAKIRHLQWAQYNMGSDCHSTLSQVNQHRRLIMIRVGVFLDSRGSVILINLS